MSIELRQELEQLAPDVDEFAAWRAFEHRRTRERRRRVIGATVGTSVLGAVLFVAAASMMGGVGGPQQVQTDPAAEHDVEHPPDPGSLPGPTESALVELDHQIVTIVEPADRVDQTSEFDLLQLAQEVQVIIDQDELDKMWRGLGLHEPSPHHEGSAPPQLDFTEQVVFVYVAATPATCADPLHLEGDETTVWFRFVEFEDPCRTRGGWGLSVITVPRHQLPDQFVLVREHLGSRPLIGELQQEVTLPPLP